MPYSPLTLLLPYTVLPYTQYNSLNAWLPRYEDDLAKKLLRSAFIGFCSSFVSDCCSNSIRVIKTTKQTATVPLTYTEVVKVGIREHAGPKQLPGNAARHMSTTHTQHMPLTYTEAVKVRACRVGRRRAQNAGGNCRRGLHVGCRSKAVWYVPTLR